MVASRFAFPSSVSWVPSIFSKCSSSTWNSRTISMANPAAPALAPTRAQASSLAALLDERANEVLGVRLEDVVYFVEDRIDVLGQFLVSLRDIRLGVSLDLVDIVGLPLRAALTTVMGRHRGT